MGHVTALLPAFSLLCLMCITGETAKAPVFNSGKGLHGKTCNDPNFLPEILSYHVHAVWDGINATLTEKALSLHHKFSTYMGVSDGWCPFSHPNAAADFPDVCPFRYDPAQIAASPWTGEGLFGGADYAFHIPAAHYLRAMDWWRQHHAEVNYMLHVNTGCENHDHTVWSMKNVEYPSAPQFNQTTRGLWCCHDGPPGCYCDIVRYRDVSSQMCLTVSNATVLLAPCEVQWDSWGADTWRETWYGYKAIGTPKAAQLEVWGEASDRGNSYRCLAAPRGCRTGAPLEVAPCAAPEARPMMSWQPAARGAPDNTTQAGKVVADSCPGMCVTVEPQGQRIVLEPCHQEMAHWERLFLD